MRPLFTYAAEIWTKTKIIKTEYLQK